ncbi:hypothetical protein ISCGN_004686 [Ixodes scapularis]
MMRTCQAACVVFFATIAMAFQPDFEIICAMPPKKGPCSDSLVQRWYHNPKSGSCEPFIYGGCGGNVNQFRTEAECRRACVKSDAQWVPLSADKTRPQAESNRCLLPKKEGPCNMRRRRYYYHAGSRSCKTFTYGGCRGNANRFRTLAACRKACIKGTGEWTWRPTTDTTWVGTWSPTTDTTWVGTWSPTTDTTWVGTWSPTTDTTWVWPPRSTASDNKETPTAVVQEETTKGICFQPLNVGFCSKEEKRFYFDAKNHTCKPFIYGGCAGNDNNFPTVGICLRMCNWG